MKTTVASDGLVDSPTNDAWAENEAVRFTSCQCVASNHARYNKRRRLYQAIGLAGEMEYDIVWVDWLVATLQSQCCFHRGIDPN
ncbi:MAG: hypothetical protein R3C05_06760 [Pirellulaceae bacterium]